MKAIAAREGWDINEQGLPYLTDDDKALIIAATGITLAPDGSVAENLTGEFPDWAFINQLNDDRRYGPWDPVTSAYLKDVLNRTPDEIGGPRTQSPVRDRRPAEA